MVRGLLLRGKEHLHQGLGRLQPLSWGRGLDADVRALASVALLLSAGCLAVPDDVDSFVVPILPSEFRGEYVNEDGGHLTVAGHMARSFDRFGRLGDVLIVNFTDDRGSTTTYGLDACDGPAWTGEIGDVLDAPRIIVQALNVSSARWIYAPIWLRSEGLSVRSGSMAELPGVQVQDLSSAGFSYVGGYGGKVRYASDPVPKVWTEKQFSQTWTLASYEGGPSRACQGSQEPPSALYGRDGPTPMVTFPEWDLPDVLAYLRGPLGPAEFAAWEDSHSDSWLYGYHFSPPIFTPIPDEVRPATWTLTFAGGSTTLDVSCESDLFDDTLPNVRPARCTTRAGTEVAPPYREGLRVADPNLFAETLQDLGLSPTTVSGSGNFTLPTTDVSAWLSSTTTSGGSATVSTQIYFIRGTTDGRLSWASLPGDSGILG